MMHRKFSIITVPAAGLAFLVLAACASDQVVAVAPEIPDYRERHPIVIGNAPRTLDVFAIGPAGLNPRQREDVRAFAAEFRQFGQSALVVQIPSDQWSSPAMRRSLHAVRSELAQSGVHGGVLVTSRYLPEDPALAAPIRLSFQRLQARVAHPCGRWPQDLGMSDAGFNAANQPHWNHGCAMQANLAAQVADPVDLVRGRPEGRIDTIRRAANIEKLRQGQDPSTQYRDEAGRIDQSLGN